MNGSITKKVIIIIVIISICTNQIVLASLFTGGAGEAGSAIPGGVSSGGSSGGASSGSTSESSSDRVNGYYNVSHYDNVGFQGNVFEDLESYIPLQYYNEEDNNISEKSFKENLEDAINEGQILYDDDTESNVLQTNGSYDEGEPKIPKVLVQFINSQDDFDEDMGKVERTVETDENGHYYVDNLPSGFYKLRYIYGFINNEQYWDNKEEYYSIKDKYGIDFESTYSDAEIKTILKYNGQDYTTPTYYSKKRDMEKSTLITSEPIKTERKSTYFDQVLIPENMLTSYQENIIKNGTGTAQVMLAIDCSYSMEAISEGTTYSKKDVAVASAKALVEKLIQNENEDRIYIGIIAFAGNDARIAALTNNKEELKEALDYVSQLSYKNFFGCTNFVEVAKTAYNSYLLADGYESNTSLIMLSDGTPTTDGSTWYTGQERMTEEEILKVLNDIAVSTNKELKRLKNDKLPNLNIIPVITRTSYETDDGSAKQEADLINTVFDGVVEENGIYTPSTLDELGKVIREDIYKDIVDKYKEDLSAFEGKSMERLWGENNIYKYNNTVLVSKIPPYATLQKTEEPERRKAIDTVFDKFNYDIISKFSVIDEFDSNKVEDVDKAKYLTKNLYMCAYHPITYIINNTQINESKATEGNQAIIMPIDLAITRRNPAQLDVDIKVTGFRLTLADGTIMEEKKANNIPIDSNLEIGEIVTDIKNISMLPTGEEVPAYFYTLDTELAHGAQVDIEYTIIVKNTSSIATKEFALINYIPGGMSFDANAKMITEDLRNSDYNWQMVSKWQLSSQNLISQEAMNKDGECLIAKFTEDNHGKIRSEKIGTNGERYIKLTYSKILAKDEKDYTYKDSVEIFEYSNIDNRRMEQRKYMQQGGKLFAENIAIIPTNLQEVDYAESIPVSIIPPMGVRYIIFNERIMGLIILISICAILIKIKNKIKNRINNK